MTLAVFILVGSLTTPTNQATRVALLRSSVIIGFVIEDFPSYIELFVPVGAVWPAHAAAGAYSGLGWNVFRFTQLARHMRGHVAHCAGCAHAVHERQGFGEQVMRHAQLSQGLIARAMQGLHDVFDFAHHRLGCGAGHGCRHQPNGWSDCPRPQPPSAPASGSCSRRMGQGVALVALFPEAGRLRELPTGVTAMTALRAFGVDQAGGAGVAQEHFLHAGQLRCPAGGERRVVLGVELVEIGHYAPPPVPH